MAGNAKISDASVLAALKRLEGMPLAPAMAGIRTAWVGRVAGGFRAGVSPYGDRWAPITHRRGQPLRDTSRLQRSVPASSRSGEDFVELGTNVEYAKRHQFGFVGQVNVKGHTRKIKQAFGKPITPKTISVKPYSYIAVTTPRQFLPTGGLPEAWKGDVLTVVSKLLRNTAKGSK